MATKKATKSVLKKTAVKKQTAVKKTNSKPNEYNIIFSIRARAIKEEDYSGASFSEWFDSGSEDYSLAKPDNYYKKGNFYEVLWENKQSIKPNIDLVEQIFDNINRWASDFEAFFLADSKITIMDNNQEIVKVFEF